MVETVLDFIYYYRQKWNTNRPLYKLVPDFISWRRRYGSDRVV